MSDYLSGINFDELTNDHKKIIEEINQLRQENEHLKSEIQQYKEALKKCDPNHGFGYCYSCDAKFNEICKNKENGNDGHRENCEYMRLTGGAE